jgi:peptide/nickel transport system permease protein
VSRMLAAIPLMFLSGTLVFFLIQFNPVDPAAALLGEDASLASIAEKRAELGLDRPLLVQYWDWLTDVVRLDLGTDWFTGETVMTMIVDRAPVTFSLVFGALTIAIISGVSLGVMAALKAGRLPDRIVTVISSFGLAIPNFWAAILLAYFLSIQVRWFPAVWSMTRTETLGGWIHSLILPCLALGLSASAAIARQSRSSMIAVLQKDYIRTALAKGLPIRRVIRRHALRNAAVPIVSLAGFQTSALIGGSIFVESVFNVPGLGSLGVDAVLRKNTPIIMAFVMVPTFVVIVVNIVLDLAYAWLNPKVRPG